MLLTCCDLLARTGAGLGQEADSVAVLFPCILGLKSGHFILSSQQFPFFLFITFFRHSVTFPKSVGINNEAMLAMKQKPLWADLLTWQLHFIKSIKDWSIRDLSRGGQKKWKAATEEFLLEQNLWSLAEMRHHDSSAKDVITQKWHQHGTKNYYHLIIFYARHFGNRYSR